MTIGFRQRLRDALIGVVIAAIAVPLAATLTILALPLWRQIEASFGIESVGHSGPASWCYLTVYLALLACAALIWRALQKK